MLPNRTVILLLIVTLGAILATQVAPAAEGEPPPEVFEWPCWKGPVGGGVAPDPGFPLVDSLEQAKLVWESEDTIPIGCQGGTLGYQRFHWGSFSSPVVADGRLFICYVRAPGRELWEIPEKPSGEELKQLKADFDWKAEDVMHCFDIKTGKTLWRHVLPKGLKSLGGKAGGHYTPCVDSGYVCAMASSGRLYCVEAASGKFMWEVWLKKPAIKNPRSYQEFVEESYQQNKRIGLPSGFNEAPGAVNGVVAMGFNRSTVRGFDIKTGEELWTVKVQGCMGGRGSTPIPVIWKHRGKKYLVAANTAIEPRSGKVLWQLPGAVTDTAPCVSEDYYVSSRYKDGKNLIGPACWRVDLQGGEKLWTLPKGHGPTLVGTDVICGEYYLTHNTQSAVCMVELATGKKLGEIKAMRTLGYSPLSCRNQTYCGMYQRNNFTVSPTGLVHTYQDKTRQRWANSCSPAMANGYLYHRTINRVSCWDLAKEPRRRRKQK